MARSDLTKRLAERALGGRSPLYRWLWSHYEEIVRARSVPSPPSWQAVADIAAEAVGTDARGHKPTAAGARLAWARVERDKMAAGHSVHAPRSRPSGPAKQPKRQEPPPAAASRTPNAAVSQKEPDPDEEDAELVRRFGAKVSPRK
jgi:hypothetical protein